jgi:hypothetical protein
MPKVTIISAARPARFRAEIIVSMEISPCVFVMDEPLEVRETRPAKNERKELQMTDERMTEWLTLIETRLTRLERHVGTTNETDDVSVEELLAGMRLIMMHTLTHMELMIPSFTVSGFRKTFFEAQHALHTNMTNREVKAWEQLIDLLLPGR